MKGIYPPLVYVLLFSIGIFVSLSFYSFTNNFVADRNFEIDEVQAEKICNFIKSLEGKEGELFVYIQDFSVQTNPLKIIGTSVYNCDADFNISGSCSGECEISVLENNLVFS